MNLAAAVRRRPMLWAVLTVVAAQLVFTAVIRGYVVPQLLPASHWRDGLQHLGDSQEFHEAGRRMADDARANGFSRLFDSSDETRRHAQILALVFYLTGSESSWPVYVVNAALGGLSVCVMVVTGLVCGLSRPRSALAATLIGLSPQSLFLHSELLREPFILPPLGLFWLGTIMLSYPEGLRLRRPRVGLAAAVAALGVGFIASASFRPYLMLPMLVSVAAVFLIALAWRLARHRRERAWRPHQAAFALTLVGLTFGYVVPESRRVQSYSEVGVSGSGTAPGPRASRLAGEGRSRLGADGRPVTRADLLVAHGCTVRWVNSALVPDRIERALESLACARQDFQNYCDPKFYGTRIDRNCDLTPISSLWDIVRHVPSATGFSLLAPLPNMWLDSFGGSGTGLRRVGYVADGIMSYVFLAGLVGLFVRARGEPRAWALIIVASGIVLAIVFYGFAVPTQFILARMRLGFYRPLLILGAYGWTRLLARGPVRVPVGQVAQDTPG